MMKDFLNKDLRFWLLCPILVTASSVVLMITMTLRPKLMLHGINLDIRFSGISSFS